MRIGVRHGVLGSLIALGIALGGGAAAAQDEVVRDYVSCGHFETQADAQAALDAGNIEDPSVLDADGDGIACEFAFGGTEGEAGGVRELPATGVGPELWTAAGWALALTALGLGAGGVVVRRGRPN